VRGGPQKATASTRAIDGYYWATEFSSLMRSISMGKVARDVPYVLVGNGVNLVRYDTSPPYEW
jgi:hypothetical protein